MYWFSFQHLLSQLGGGLSDSSGAMLLSACIQLTQRSHHLNTNLKSSGLFLQHCSLQRDQTCKTADLQEAQML